MSSGDPRSWLQLARDDVQAAQRLLQPPPVLRQAAFFAQQAAEKTIKARLIALRMDYPKRGGRGHDLRILIDLLPAADPLTSSFAPLADLTPWATVFRYPSDDPATEPVVTAEEIARHIRAVTTAIEAVEGALT